MARIESLSAENKFKKTEIGEIPVDWEVAELGKVAKITMGQSPSSKDCFDYENGLPFFQGKAEFGTKYPRVLKWCNSPKKIAERDDTLISIRAPVGDVNIAPAKCCIGRGLAAIRGINIDNNFLYFVMLSLQTVLGKIGQGSTFEAINKDVLFKLKTPYPPLPEQQNIAQILSTVDETIEKSREIIEKEKQFKKGLMQELLTRGIGHKRFKKTKMGTIPEEWEVVKLRKIGKLKGGNGFPEKYQGYTDRKYLFIKVSDMNIPGNEIYMYNAINSIDDEIMHKIKCELFPKSSIVFAKVGAALLLNRRRILVKESCIDNNMMGLVINRGLSPKFYYFIMQTIDFAKFVFPGALPSINQTILGNIDIVKPPLSEQENIAEILSAVDDKIEKEIANKEKLEKLKKGLMQVLLTGKIRVHGVESL